MPCPCKRLRKDEMKKFGPEIEYIDDESDPVSSRIFYNNTGREQGGISQYNQIRRGILFCQYREICGKPILKKDSIDRNITGIFQRRDESESESLGNLPLLKTFASESFGPVFEIGSPPYGLVPGPV
jgi:hypothetical protein